jgi:hypothetical protein
MKILTLALLLLPILATAQTPPADTINSATVARLITPTNGALLPLGPTRMLFVGATACNVNIILANDVGTVLFTGVSGFVPVRAKDVEALNTTCTPIVGLW